MRFNCGLSDEEKVVWHRWFAWKPVKVGPHDCRWLEYVERRVSWRPATGACIYFYRKC